MARRGGEKKLNVYKKNAIVERTKGYKVGRKEIK